MRIAGCSFFALLLKAVKDGYSKKNSYGSTSIKESDVLVGLIRVFYPEYPNHDDNTQSNYTSVFKSGKTVKGEILPFGDSRLTKAFDNLVTNSYPRVLERMTFFVNKTLNIESNTICIWLVKALYELLDADKTTDDAFFYVTADGKMLRKDILLKQKQVYLPAFLLGIWHFIVCHRPDNSVGTDTVANWYKKASKGIRSKRNFTSSIGSSSRYEIQLTGKKENCEYPMTIESPTYNMDNAQQNPNVIPDMQEIDTSGFVIVEANNTKKDSSNAYSEGQRTQQIIKTDKIIQQQANKIYNIEHIENFNA